MHLADLTGYVQTQEKVAALYRDPARRGLQKAIHNVARSGQVLQRPDDRRVRERHLGREGVPGGLSD